MSKKIKDPKSIHPKFLLKLINKAKEYLKKDKTMKRICDDYDCDVSIIDTIPTRFGEIDVSAKTDHGIIILNYELLEDGDFFKDYSYLVHEYTHYLQQCMGKKATQGADDGNYLDNPYEKEGFQNQVQFISDQFGDKEAEKYVEHLLEHHDMSDDVEKKEELMSLV